MPYQYPNAVIQVFCKAPIAGQVKTRLTPELTADQAVQVHQRLTIQTLELVTHSQLCSVQLWCSPTVSHPFFKQMTDTFSLPLFTQSQGDLGQRMFEALNFGSHKFEHVVLIGCDCPSLTKEDFSDALQALSNTHNTVLAPAEDGGYCLIGSNKPHIEMFSNINWGTNGVLDKTREKIHSLKLNCLEINTQWDVDHYADYVRYCKLK